MRKPEETRERILKQSGRLFNTQGYKATSLSDITEASGLTKGAIYQHFKNKEKLEAETLQYLSQIMVNQLTARIKAQSTAPEKLRAMFDYFKSYVTQPPVKGGCPLLNVAIECDDSNPILRKQAVTVLDTLKNAIIHILANGVKYHQIKPDTDGEHYATLIIASLEGAIMMSKLRGNNKDIAVIVKHLELLLKEIEL